MNRADKTRTDEAYWSQPLGIRIYYRVLYALGGGLFFAWMLDRFGIDGNLQWLAFFVLSLFILTFRWILPNGFNGMLQDALVDDDAARRELAEGKYDGIPSFMRPVKGGLSERFDQEVTRLSNKQMPSKTRKERPRKKPKKK